MPPDLLMIELSPPAAGQLTCTVHVARPDDVGPRRWRQTHAVDAAAVERELHVLGGTRAAVARREAPPDDLRLHGALLFDLLLPAAVKAELRRRDGGPLYVVGWPEVPWPLVHDGRGFLGQRFELGEGRGDGPWPASTPPTIDRMLVLADPAGDLPAARAEGEALAAILAAAGNAPAYDVRLGRQGRAEVLRALRRYRTVHYAGHIDPAEAGGGWRFDGGHLDPESIARLRGGSMPRLVFANACRSLGPTGEALLEAGVRHLIGTDLDLPDLQGADFARDVHRALTLGRTIGGALRLARNRAAERRDPAWTAYRLVGDPRTRFAEADTVRQSELRRVVALVIRRPLPEGLEARVEASRSWRATVEQAARDAGARLLPAAGRLVRVVFGVPARREDDVRRAAALALQLQAHAPDATMTLETGRLAVAGETLLGGPLDDAEQANWRRPAGIFPGPAATRTLRGLARMDGDSLVGLQPTSRPTGPFVGRDEELAQLDRLADQAVDGSGAALSIIGPAGIGKSRLLDAAEARLGRRARVFRVAGDDGGPFGGIERLVRRLCRLDPDEPPAQTRRRIEQALVRTSGVEDFLSIDDLLDDRGADLETRRRHADTLAAIAGLAEAEKTSPATVVPALRALFEAAAEARPLVVFFEDGHLTPAPALATLIALMDQPPPALLVATDRPDGPLARRSPSRRHGRLDLSPLSTATARALIAALCPDADGLDALVERAEGNPLFVHELARHRPDLDEALPASIEALMQARIDRLDPADLEVLRAAAVLGRTFWQGGVVRLVGRAGVDARLDRLAAARFVAREPRSSLAEQVQWRFEHGLLHAVVAAGLPRQLRAALHGRAALWLADELPPPIGPRAADIARHRAAAGDLERAVHDWLAAADHAEATLAPDSATAALEAAEALLDDVRPTPDLQATIHARLGTLDHLAGRLDDAADRLTRAAAETTGDALRAQRLARLGAVELARGSAPAARKAVDTAVELLAAAPDADPAIRAEVVYQAAWTDYHEGDLDGARTRLETLLDDLPADDDRGPAWRLLGTIAQQRGDADGARYWLERALGVLHDDVERARVLHGLALVAVQRGDYDEAAGHYAQTVRIRARLGDRAGLARTYSNLGTLCGERGDFVRAERYLREAIRIRTRLRHGSLAISHANLVELYLRQGRADAARAELDRVTALLDAGRAPAWARSELWRIIADVRLQGGELEAAEAAAERAVSVAREMGDPLRVASGLEVQARIAVARTRPADAIRAVERAIEIYEDHEATGALIGAMGQLADLLDPIDPARATALRSTRELMRDD